jgi:hypothetical protein
VNPVLDAASLIFNWSSLALNISCAVSASLLLLLLLLLLLQCPRDSAGSSGVHPAAGQACIHSYFIAQPLRSTLEINS